MEAVVSAIKRGDTLRTVVEDHTVAFIKYHHGIERTLAFLQPAPPREQPRVFILYGGTGTGKSRACAELYPQAYWFPRPQNGAFYAMGYVGQHVVVFDDFYSWVKYDFLLRICDRYPLTVNVMGGTAPFLATTIIFTSNMNPKNWYSGILDKSAFFRRVTEIFHFEDIEKLDQMITLIKTSVN